MQYLTITFLQQTTRSGESSVRRHAMLRVQRAFPAPAKPAVFPASRLALPPESPESARLDQARAFATLVLAIVGLAAV